MVMSRLLNAARCLLNNSVCGCGHQAINFREAVGSCFKQSLKEERGWITGRCHCLLCFIALMVIFSHRSMFTLLRSLFSVSIKRMLLKPASVAFSINHSM